MIFQLWPSKSTAVLGLLGDVITTFYFGLLTYCSYTWSSNFFGVLSLTMRIPIVIVYFVIPVSGMCMFFLELEHTLEDSILFKKIYITHELEREHSVLENKNTGEEMTDGSNPENNKKGGE